MRRLHLQPAYILHSRPYQETSLLLEVFTQDFGRFGVIAKGVRRQKNPARALLQLFVPLLISCSGRGELLILKSYEMASKLPILSGRRIISAFYLNELLMRLLHRFDAHEELFQLYTETLIALEQITCEQTTLRLFEKALLKMMGYELQLTRDTETDNVLSPEGFYIFDPERGPRQIGSITPLGHGTRTYSGKSLIALANDCLEDPAIQREVKHLMRHALQLRLGPKPLETRQLFS